MTAPQPATTRGSILSFPDRGPWGDPRYPGNCSGHVIRFLIEQYRPKLLVDPMEGSGTSRAVASEMGIRYVGLDLCRGFDLTAEPLRDQLGDEPAELVFVHPPYWHIVPYSGEVWGTEADPRDLSRAPDYDTYLARLRWALRNALGAVRSGGRLAVLIGDIRQRGAYYSPQAVIIGWNLARLEAVLIKVQHHVRSDAKTYSTNGLIRILHEYLLIFRV